MRGRIAPAVDAAIATDDSLATFLGGLTGAMGSICAVLAAERDPGAPRAQLLRDEERRRSLDPGSVPHVASAVALGVGYL